MKLRLAVLVTIAAALAVWLVVDWRKTHRKPAYDNFDFLPIVRGLKSEWSEGDITHGRTDAFLIHRPRRELELELLRAHIGSVIRMGPYKFPLVTPDPPGYSAVNIKIYALVSGGVASKDWSHVYVFRRTAPITHEEIAEARRKDMVSYRLGQIREAIMRDHKLSIDDKQFLVQATGLPSLASKDASSLITGETSALALVNAEDEKLLPRSEVLDVIGRIVERAKPDQVGIYVSIYAMALHLPTRPTDDVDVEEQATRKARKDPRKLDQAEREFVARALKGPKGQNDSIAAGILTQKRGADAESLQWLNQVIEARIRATEGDRLLLWRFVKQAVAVRNGPQSQQ